MRLRDPLLQYRKSKDCKLAKIKDTTVHPLISFLHTYKPRVHLYPVFLMAHENTVKSRLYNYVK